MIGANEPIKIAISSGVGAGGVAAAEHYGTLDRSGAARSANLRWHLQPIAAQPMAERATEHQGRSGHARFARHTPSAGA